MISADSSEEVAVKERQTNTEQSGIQKMCIKCRGKIKLIKHGNSLSLGGKAKEGVKDSLRFLTRTECVIKMSSKCVSNILLLLFLVIFMFFLSEHILFNSYKNKGLLLL